MTIISAGDTAIHATFAIPVATSGGNLSVSVTVPGQPPSNKVNFFVQIPTSLIRQAYPGDPPKGAPDGYGPLETPDGTQANGNVINAAGDVMASNKCGVYRNLAYSVVDQETPPVVIQGSLMGVEVYEAFSNFSGATPAPTAPDPTPTFDLVNCPGGNGSNKCAADITDIMFIGHKDSSCLATNENQSFTQTFSVAISGKSFPLSLTNSVSRGNFDGTLKVDVTISKQ